MNGVDSLARVLAMAGLGQGGGGGETPTSYNQLSDKPLVNGFELIGSLTGDQLGLQDAIDEDHKLPAEYVSGLADVAFSGEYDDLINKPALADVAISGDYNDLINKPEQITKTSELINDGSDGEHPFLTEHQSLDDYATKTDLETKQDVLTDNNLHTVNGQSLIGKGNIQIDVPSLDGYATEEWVEEQNYLKEIPTASQSILGGVKIDGTTILIDENGVISSTGGGIIYEEGEGIKIDDNVISADLDVLASKEDLENKQDNLTDEQIAATESGITAENYEQINDDVDEIKRQLEEDIPTKEDLESKQNKLTEGLGILIEDSTNTIMVDSSYVATKTDLEDKQDTLQSGVNIKTINNQSLLGSGNITIEGSEYEQGKGIIIDDNVIINALAVDLPEDAKVLGQVEEMPEGAETGTVVQYIGPTTENYTHNYFYEYGEDGWEQVNVQPSSGQGTSDYNDLTNKPKINNITIVGNKSLEDLGIYDKDYIDDSLDAKQDILESGINIKTINGETILGNGNIVISGGTEYTEGKGIDITNHIITNTLAEEMLDGAKITNQVEELPEEAAPGTVVQYIGDTTEQHTHNYFYEYTEEEGWIPVDVQKSDNIEAYLKNASVSGNTLTITKQDDTTLSFTPAGEGGITDVTVNGSSVVSEGVAIIENMATTDDIPTKTSDLTNDSGFITNSYHDNTKQDKLTAGTGIIIDENNVVTYDEVEVSSVEYVDANITDTMNFIIQERNTERTARIAGDDLLQDQLDDVKEDISGLEDDKQDKITSSNKLSYSLISDTPDIPSKTSDLTNDSNFVEDSDYIHTDNNYTDEEKQKLAGLENYDDTEIRNLLNDKADKSTTYTKVEVNNLLNNKQDNLISGSNIKTINGTSILGSGNIQIGDKDSLLQFYELPDPTYNIGNIVQYIGETGKFTNGYIYKAGETGGFSPAPYSTTTPDLIKQDVLAEYLNNHWVPNTHIITLVGQPWTNSLALNADGMQIETFYDLQQFKESTGIVYPEWMSISNINTTLEATEPYSIQWNECKVQSEGSSYIAGRGIDSYALQQNNTISVLDTIIDNTYIANYGRAGLVKPDGSTITMDYDGTIHAGSVGGEYLKQYKTMIQPTEENEVVQYIGQTTGDYTQNYIYKAVESENKYLIKDTWTIDTLMFNEHNQNILNLMVEQNTSRLRLEIDEIVQQGPATIYYVTFFNDEIGQKLFTIMNNELVNLYEIEFVNNQLAQGKYLTIKSKSDLTWERTDVQPGGGGGTTDYTQLSNKPSINNVVLQGDKPLSAFGIQQALTGGEGIVINNTVIDDRVHVGTEEPEYEYKNIWIDPSASTTIQAEDIVFEDEETLEDKMDSKQDKLTAGPGINATALSTNNRIEQTYASNTAIGGIKIRFDENTNSLYIRTDGEDA